MHHHLTSRFESVYGSSFSWAETKNPVIWVFSSRTELLQTRVKVLLCPKDLLHLATKIVSSLNTKVIFYLKKDPFLKFLTAPQPISPKL